MKLEKQCPFCCGNECKIEQSSSEIWRGQDAIYIACEDGIECTLHPSVLHGEEKDVVKRIHQMYLLMRKKPYIKVNGINSKYYFFYEESTIGKQTDHPQKVNVAELVRDYPRTFMERMEKSLFNLSVEFPVFGYTFEEKIEMHHLLYCEGIQRNVVGTEILGRLDALIELGYLNNALGGYRISAKGWNKISEMEQQSSSNQGFIAMAFREETRGISEAFKNAIMRCGYIPRRIDEKEHNKQIVPEILYEIAKSKFVVVDITYPNYGAYYEAGYAEALGKEVIICCRNAEFKPHFDIAQKSAVVWSDEKDLEERLCRRIEATVEGKKYKW